MTPEQILALMKDVPAPVWSALSDAITSVVRGDGKAAALHAQAAAARQAAHLALHAKDPKP